MNSKKQPGYESHTPLDVRMKIYESVTDYSLIPRVPVYARLDGRAFHTFCRGLDRPFDMEFFSLMKAVTKRLHAETNAELSFCQSDEISLVFRSPEKMPFGTRLFKIQSVLAGMASAAFCVLGAECASEKIRCKVRKTMPHFDCRVCQMPLDECANMVLWRSQDAAKNSITQLALAHFSAAQIHRRNGDEKIAMLREKGVDYWTAVPEDVRLGAFFRREVYEKVLTDDEVARIPERSRMFGPDGRMRATRSRISQFGLGMDLADVANKTGALFDGEDPVRRQSARKEGLQ